MPGATRESEAGEWVVYRPPKSAAFGHQSRPRDPRHAWSILERFLTNHTRFWFGDYISLECFRPGARTEATVATVRIEEARRRFGPEIASSSDVGQMNLRWKIGEGEIGAAVQFALDDDKVPPQEFGPTWFCFSYQFMWKNPDQFSPTRAASESRKEISVLGLILGQRRLFVQPTFVFPAPWNARALREFVALIETDAPFRFRDQYFKRWLPPGNPKKNGRTLKLDAHWRSDRAG